MANTRKFSLAALVVAACSCGAWAQAGDVIKGSGLSVYAPFWWTDDTGCVRTELSISAGESLAHDPPGPPTPSSMGWVSVTRYNTCIPEWIFGGFGMAQGIQLRGDRGLNRATLEGTVRVCQDYPVQICLDFQIDVAWDATGPAQRNTYVNSVQVGGTSARTRQTGEFRAAKATGSVSADGENWAPLPLVEGWAWLSYNQSLQVLVNW